jgi:hypothetical protein
MYFYFLSFIPYPTYSCPVPLIWSSLKEWVYSGMSIPVGIFSWLLTILYPECVLQCERVPVSAACLDWVRARGRHWCFADRRRMLGS